MTWSVYEVRCLRSGCVFVAMSRRPSRAWAMYRNELGRQEHCNADLQAAWDFYHPSDFAFAVVADGLDETAARVSVRALIAEAASRGLAFNIGPGVKADRTARKATHPPKDGPNPRRRVVVFGVAYESISDAARSLGVEPSTIWKRLKSHRWPDHQYTEAS